MKTFYATFGLGNLLGNHILKLYAIDEFDARCRLNESNLLKSCVAFIYDENQGKSLIEKYNYKVIESKTF